MEWVKVIDLSRYFSGPYCTKLFDTLGAEVIKIESPTTVTQSEGMVLLPPQHQLLIQAHGSSTLILLSKASP